MLTGILDQAGVPRDKHDDALISLDKMDKAGAEGVARELNQRGIVDESAVKLMRFFEGLAGAEHAADLIDLNEFGDARAAYNADVLGRLVEFVGPHEAGAKGVDELRQIIQFAKAAARRTIGAPDRLNLVALEELRQLVLILRDYARQRDSQIVSQREIGFAALFMLTALEDFEDELVPFFAVFAH